MHSHFTLFFPITWLVIAYVNHGVNSHEHGHGEVHEPFVHDVEHIKEDIGDIDKDSVDNMTQDELEFQYFRLHDHDNNVMLDGLEILTAINHHAKNMSVDDNLITGSIIEEAAAAVDLLFTQADSNNDGYIEYSEYKKASQAQNAPANPQ